MGIIVQMLDNATQIIYTHKYVMYRHLCIYVCIHMEYMNGIFDSKVDIYTTFKSYLV